MFVFQVTLRNFKAGDKILLKCKKFDAWGNYSSGFSSDNPELTGIIIEDGTFGIKQIKLDDGTIIKSKGDLEDHLLSDLKFEIEKI